MWILIMIMLTINVSYEVEATCYQPVPSQTDGTPDQTASGAMIDLCDPLSHRWIAVSRDLEGLGFTFGQKVLVTGTKVYDGVWTVQDRMNKRWTKRIDFLVGVDDYVSKWDSITIKLIN